MKWTTATSLVAVLAIQFSGVMADKTVAAAAPSQTPSTLPIPGARTSQGCFSSSGNLTQVPVENMSSGSCNDACLGKNYWVTALHGNDCYCGYAYPPKDDLVNDSSCSFPCPSYPLEACGGLGDPSFYSVFNTGINIDVHNYKPEASTTSAATSTTAAQTSAAQTVEVTETPTSKPSKEKSGGPNVAGIAAGVVVGVVVVAACVGGLFFYMRRRRNAEIEEEHRRNAAVNAFISGSKPPSSHGSISMTDSRLDPIMANRRLSDGSIADNEDYSRRILRVTNA